MFKYLQLGLMGIVGAAVIAASSYHYGKSVEKEEIKIEMAEEALDRIEEMGENNEEFLELSDRDRCIEFMRTSELPIDICNER